MNNDLGCILGCGRVARTRGLCNRCYSKTIGMIKIGEETWESLIAQGKALPSINETIKFTNRPIEEWCSYGPGCG